MEIENRANLRGDRMSPLLNLLHLRGLQVFNLFVNVLRNKYYIPGGVRYRFFLEDAA